MVDCADLDETNDAISTCTKWFCGHIRAHENDLSRSKRGLRRARLSLEKSYVDHPHNSFPNIALPIQSYPQRKDAIR